jgi:hypothetical protein
MRQAILPAGYSSDWYAGPFVSEIRFTSKGGMPFSLLIVEVAANVPVIFG